MIKYRDSSRHFKANLVTIDFTGSWGRPEKVINRDWLHEATSTKWNLTFTEISRLLGIHRNTLQYKLRNMGLYCHFTQLSNEDLDHVLKIYKKLQPSSGLHYTAGFL